MNLQEIPKSERIEQTLEWVYRIGALRAALELRLWEKIPLGGISANELGKKEGWNILGTGALLDVICALNLLYKEEELYYLTPESEYYLIPEKSTYKGVVFENEFSWEGNGKLAQAVRSGKRPIQYDATAPETAGLYLADYSRRWVYPESYFESDEKIWQLLDIWARDGLRILDIACGPAPISLALARHHPGVSLTWVDWEDVLKTAQNLATRLGVSDQVTCLVGDLWAVDFGEVSCDVAFLGNVTHFFSPEGNTRLFKRVFSALAPGGVIAIQTVLRREYNNASAALWLYAATESGGAYDFDEYKSMLEQAGFFNVADVNQGPIRAAKPAS